MVQIDAAPAATPQGPTGWQRWVQKAGYWPAVAVRCLLALVGGYGVSILFTIALLAWPAERASVVLWGALLSFWVYTVAVIYVFAARSATRACVGMGLAAAVLAVPAWWVWSGQGGA